MGVKSGGAVERHDYDIFGFFEGRDKLEDVRKGLISEIFDPINIPQPHPTLFDKVYSESVEWSLIPRGTYQDRPVDKYDRGYTLDQFQLVVLGLSVLNSDIIQVLGGGQMGEGRPTDKMAPWYVESPFGEEGTVNMIKTVIDIFGYPMDAEYTVEQIRLKIDQVSKVPGNEIRRFCTNHFMDKLLSRMPEVYDGDPMSVPWGEPDAARSPVFTPFSQDFSPQRVEKAPVRTFGSEDILSVTFFMTARNLGNSVMDLINSLYGKYLPEAGERLNNMRPFQEFGGTNVPSIQFFQGSGEG